MKRKIVQEEAFFSQIEEVLQTHEDAYEIGAWEEFVATRKKEKRRWPIYAWAAAAVVLLLLSFGLFEITKKDQLHMKAVVVKNDGKQPNTNIDAVVKANPDQVIERNEFVEDKLIVHKSPITTHKDDIKPVLVIENPANQVITSANPVIATVKQSNPAIAAPVVPKDIGNTPVAAGSYDSLVNRNQVATLKEKNTKKLTYSLVVSPAMSNQKINFGGGMELSYKLGQHLSVSSGLMYTAITAKSDGNSLVASNSRAQAANLALTGIELPLGIQYHTKGGFYATAGVSALGLINDKLEYNYLSEGTASMPSYSAGIANDVLVAVNEKQTEKSIEPLNNYMGFFNFSAGKKQAFGNVNLNIGPFVRVPFSSVTSEKIKLLQGGVKISIDF